MNDEYKYKYNQSDRIVKVGDRVIIDKLDVLDDMGKKIYRGLSESQRRSSIEVKNLKGVVESSFHEDFFYVEIIEGIEEKGIRYLLYTDKFELDDQYYREKRVNKILDERRK